MELKRRNFLIYGVVLAIWALVIAWQVGDHHRAKELARAGLLGRSREIANLVGAFIRGSARFRMNIAFQDRIEPMLNEMVNTSTNELLKASDVLWIALLNAEGEPLASAGTPTLDYHREIPEGGLWQDGTMTKEYVVAGARLGQDTNPVPTVVPPAFRDFTNNPSDPFRSGGRRGDGRPDGPPPDFRPAEGFRGSGTAETVGTNGIATGERQDPRPPRRPPWARGMSESEYEAFIKRRELHGLVVAMSTDSVQAIILHDFWQRGVIVLFACLSAIGVAMAWRNLAKTSDLQIRLVRASELNTHLKELNLAAAGLAHETRNPLNIIRGMAQMISKQPGTAPEVQEKSRAIVDESDKVTAQLNEFINYSRPREVRRSPLKLNSIITEVVRALTYDIEEKNIRVDVKGDQLTVDADEQLLRQVLFNLALNAIQAVGHGGEIQVVTQRTGASEASIEVRDNGPGVPPERRAEIFKPYFTTQAKGTGLGLAIVQQNALAHGWDVVCLPNEPQGAVFRTTHLKLAKA